MRCRLGHECELLAQVPRCRGLSEDAVLIRFAKLTPRGLQQVPAFRDECGAPRKEKKKLATQVQRVTRMNDRPLAPNPVYLQFAAADALDEHAVLLRREQKLTAR